MLHLQPKAQSKAVMQMEPAQNREFLSPWLAEGINPYGYRVNIRNPYINGLYRSFYKKQKIPLWCPLSDEQRFEFEMAVIPHLEKRFNCKAPPPNLPPCVREKLPIKLLMRIYDAKNMDALLQIPSITK